MAEEKKYTITEAAEIVGYEPHVIRFYEKEFRLQIPRNQSNHRYFTRKEIEMLKFIKDLQERGFSNTQIKWILQTTDPPKLDYQDVSDAAVSNQNARSGFQTDGLEEMMESLKKDIIEEMRNQLEFTHQPIRMALTGLAEEVKELVKSFRLKEEDVLVCENARLKMQLKQKTVELLHMKEQLKKEKSKNQSFLMRMFGK